MTKSHLTLNELQDRAQLVIQYPVRHQRLNKGKKKLSLHRSWIDHFSETQ